MQETIHCIRSHSGRSTTTASSAACYSVYYVYALYYEAHKKECPYHTPPTKTCTCPYPPLPLLWKYGAYTTTPSRVSLQAEASRLFLLPNWLVINLWVNLLELLIAFVAAQRGPAEVNIPFSFLWHYLLCWWHRLYLIGACDANPDFQLTLRGAKRFLVHDCKQNCFLFFGL